MTYINEERKKNEGDNRTKRQRESNQSKKPERKRAPAKVWLQQKLPSLPPEKLKATLKQIIVLKVPERQ